MLLTASWLSVALKSEVRIWTRVGNDDVDLGGLMVDSFVHGGDGDDNIVGGAARDLVFGGLGGDDITAAAGNDLLVRGRGRAHHWFDRTRYPRRREFGDDISRDDLLAASYLHVAVEDCELIGQLFQ